jgi:hypothetical protein
MLTKGAQMSYSKTLLENGRNGTVGAHVGEGVGCTGVVEVGELQVGILGEKNFRKQLLRDIRRVVKRTRD